VTEVVIARTVAWLEKAVIGLNLCPFAKAVHVRGQIRYVVSAATAGKELLRDLKRELVTLHETPAAETDTTLLIHPRALRDFFAYNDFLGDAQAALEELELDGELQIASFHPDYCFADAATDDPANFTNRSPYPMLHLLREESVTRAVDGFADTSKIYERNMETLRRLPEEQRRALFGDD
jgi:uncharacterized protein